MATPTTLPATFVAGNVLTAAQMNNLRGAFRILQVVNATVTTDQTTTSATLIDLTGATVTITPSSTTSNILLFFNSALNGTSNSTWFRLFRGATGLFEEVAVTQNTGGDNGVIIFLDSPATTSSTTYKAQFRSNGSATNTSAVLIAMEISA